MNCIKYWCENIKTLFLQPTPANEHVDGETDGGFVDDKQQRVQVQTLHQQPEEVGHDKVVKEHQDGFTAHLTHTHTFNVYNFISTKDNLIWHLVVLIYFLPPEGDNALESNSVWIGYSDVLAFVFNSNIFV